MAKKKTKKGKKTAAVAPPSLFTPPAVDIGRTVEVAVKSERQGDTTFTLADGTVIHAKVIASSVARSLEKFNPNGEPVYLIQAGLMIKTVVPKKLKKKI
jgi:hypothetical protein